MPTALLLSTSPPPNRALPKLFPTVSLPSTLSSLPYRSFPSELSPSYFPRFPPPSTFSSLPFRSFHTELSPCYFPRFPSVHPIVASIRSLPTELSPSYFPRFPLRQIRIAPSRQVQLNENPSIGDALGKKSIAVQKQRTATYHLSSFRLVACQLLIACLFMPSLLRSCSSEAGHGDVSTQLIQIDCLSAYHGFFIHDLSAQVMMLVYGTWTTHSHSLTPSLSLTHLYMHIHAHTHKLTHHHRSV